MSVPEGRSVYLQVPSVPPASPPSPPTAKSNGGRIQIVVRPPTPPHKLFPDQITSASSSGQPRDN